MKVKLKDTGKNIHAIGSKVNIYAGNKKIYNELIPTKGFQSSVEYTLTVGLGDIEVVDSIEVVWPDQSRTLTYSLLLTVYSIFKRKIFSLTKS